MIEFFKSLNGWDITVILFLLCGSSALVYGWKSAKMVLSLTGLLMLLALAAGQMLAMRVDLPTLFFVTTGSILVLYAFIIRWKKRHRL